MTPALDTQLDLLASEAPPLKHQIPTSVLAQGAQTCRPGKLDALFTRSGTDACCFIMTLMVAKV
jgi:hypothetical protein